LANAILPRLTKIIEGFTWLIDNKISRGIIIFGSSLIIGAGLILKAVILFKGMSSLFKSLFNFSNTMNTLGRTLPKMASTVGNSIKNFVQTFANIDIRAIGKGILVMGALSVSMVGLGYAMKQFN